MPFRRSLARFRRLPAWMQLGVPIFIALLVAQQVSAPKTAPPSAPQETGLSADSPASPTAPLPLVETVRQAVPLEKYKTALAAGEEPELNDITPGEGAMLLCGQRVSGQYRLFVEHPTPAATEPRPFDFPFGAGKAPLLLERSITGMRVGGMRRITPPTALPATQLGLRAEGQPEGALITALEITLTQAEPDAATLLTPQEHALALRLYDQRTGEAPEVLCGEKVRAHLTLWRIDGQKLWDSRAEANSIPVTIAVGAGALPAGLELGLIGMQKGGVRTLLIPPAWLNPLQPAQNSLEQNPSPLHKLAIPPDSLLVADVELVEIVNAAPKTQ